MTERWLVTGGTGQVGSALRRLPLPGIEVWTPTRSELDLANLPADLRPMLKGISAIVSCGAYTAVDKAESEPELAHSVNAAAPARLAEAAASLAIPIVHVSTDYVFPADQTGPWSETDPTAPASTYGLTKLAGERAIQQSDAKHAIIRTAWVVSADGHNFIKTMLRIGAQNNEVRVVSDQRGTPTHAGDLASALAAVTAQFTSDRAQRSGIWHCSNQGETTWHGLAERTFGQAAKLGLQIPEKVTPISTADYPTPARRPLDSRLNSTRLEADFGLRLRPWESAVDEIVAQLAQEMKRK